MHFAFLQESNNFDFPKIPNSIEHWFLTSRKEITCIFNWGEERGYMKLSV